MKPSISLILLASLLCASTIVAEVKNASGSTSRPSTSAETHDTTSIKGDYIGNLELPKEYPSELIRKAICRAAVNRDWRVVEHSTTRVTINLVHRKYDATLSFVIAPSILAIYSDSYKGKMKDGEFVRKKRKDPEGWIENVKKDIPIMLDRLETGVY